MKLRKVLLFAPQKYFKVEVRVAVVKLSQDRSFFFKVLLKCMKNRCAQEFYFRHGETRKLHTLLPLHNKSVIMHS